MKCGDNKSNEFDGKSSANSSDGGDEGIQSVFVMGGWNDRNSSSQER